MATKNKTAAPKTNPVAAVLATTRAALAAEAKKAAKPTKAPKPAKLATRFQSSKPAKLDPVLSAAKGAPTATPKAKRTVSQAGAVRLSDVPKHQYHDVASLAQVLGTFPRGSTVDLMDDYLAVYNLRGRPIADIRKGDKPKTSRANKL